MRNQFTYHTGARTRSAVPPPPVVVSPTADEEMNRNSADYVRWMQSALNRTVKSNIVPSGTMGLRTRQAIRAFQRGEGLPANGLTSHRTQQRLIERSRSLPPRSISGETYEEESAEAVGVAFEILKSVITPMTQGDIQVTWPTSPIGVTWPQKPSQLRFHTVTSDRLIINWRKTNPISGIEQVNVKLRCHVQYNGPEVQATFSFDAEGRRSRLMRDTYVTINNPLSLDTRTTPADWQKIGVPEYPIVRIPIEFRVDQPWPLDNYNETFTLVLSGMSGFGAFVGDNPIKDRRIVWN
jgi:peptidoglycan hydrolase-like protein with peptidoglycan-binding domain